MRKCPSCISIALLAIVITFVMLGYVLYSVGKDIQKNPELLNPANYEAVNPNNSDMIRVSVPLAEDLVQSPLTVEGEARGSWYVEGSFPVSLVDAKGSILAKGHAEALGDWTTGEFVSFRAELEFFGPVSSPLGYLILKKDNPSGLPEQADEMRIAVRFR